MSCVRVVSVSVHHRLAVIVKWFSDMMSVYFVGELGIAVSGPSHIGLM